MGSVWEDPMMKGGVRRVLRRISVRILVIGGGGREHAIVHKVSASRRVDKIYVTPGNGGIAQEAECVDAAKHGKEAILDFARKWGIDLAIVGPEAYLAEGVVDLFRSEGIPIFGPTRDGAAIESDKAFAKGLMSEKNIPTARWRSFTDAAAAREFARELLGASGKVVIKAAGLAQGKGVVICQSEGEALDAIADIMEKRLYGDAGRMVVVEEFLQGREVSILTFTDGKAIKPMLPAQDHKRLLDGDRGPNTGGMGAYAPVPFVGRELQEECMKAILKPIVAGMAARGRHYTGVLYAGLMLVDSSPKVLEFNCRFGDPETQAILPLLETDLVEICEAVWEGRLDQQEINWSTRACACVVLASQGYPVHYETGKEIRGLERLAGQRDVMVFHAGTREEGGRFFTSGGRVLSVTALGDTLQEALARAYAAVEEISFEGMHYRKDMGIS